MKTQFTHEGLLNSKGCGSLPFPNDYEDVKDSYLDFMETAIMIDIKMQPMNEIVDKIDKATDKFAKYLLRQ